MKHKRTCGVLLHPTSFPGQYGIGDLGSMAYRFIDFLAEAGVSTWQILPLGPTGYGDSPYASFSSFAGNPLLIDLDQLVTKGDLTPIDLADLPEFPKGEVDYGWVQYWKKPKLTIAASNFLKEASDARKEEYKSFCREHKKWLDDFTLFIAVKAFFDDKAQSEGVNGAMWSNFWDKDIALKTPEGEKKWKAKLKKEIEIQKVWQYYFFKQWKELKAYANKNQVEIVGDIPIFVAADSADVWANKEFFHLDKDGQPTVVAGVPPDYFSKTGQRWGNPLYNWEVMEADGFKWWLRRIESMLEMVDIIRIDHFRGFEDYWEIPAKEKTAVKGRWVNAPGRKLFKQVKKTLGKLPILAEDLGIITQAVRDLRDEFGFPGMNIMHFAYEIGDPALIGTHLFLPHNYVPNSVVYTGSHDNDTTRGWYNKATEAERSLVREYFQCSDSEVVWQFIRAAIASVSRFAIIPLQDLLNLDDFARMNTPGRLGGNWVWRFSEDAMHPDLAASLRRLIQLYGRLPEEDL